METEMLNDAGISDYLARATKRAGPSYYGPENALLDFGIMMEPSVEPSPFSGIGKRNQCYANCIKALLKPDQNCRLFYAEGYATSKDGSMPWLQHAWLVNETGNVIDPTWNDAHEQVYYGLVFDASFVFDMLEKTDGHTGILASPTLMRQHVGSREFFVRALAPGFHHRQQTHRHLSFDYRNED